MPKCSCMKVMRAETSGRRRLQFPFTQFGFPVFSSEGWGPEVEEEEVLALEGPLLPALDQRPDLRPRQTTPEVSTQERRHEGNRK